jgi:hypothetical protein
MSFGRGVLPEVRNPPAEEPVGVFIVMFASSVTGLI